MDRLTDSLHSRFMFFILVSEIKQPRDAMKAAYTLQGFATALLRHLRNRMLRVPWEQRSESGLLLARNKVSESGLWYRHSEFPHCWFVVRTHGREADLRPNLSQDQVFAFPHLDSME